VLTQCLAADAETAAPESVDGGKQDRPPRIRHVPKRCIKNHRGQRNDARRGELLEPRGLRTRGIHANEHWNEINRHGERGRPRRVIRHVMPAPAPEVIRDIQIAPAKSGPGLTLRGKDEVRSSWRVEERELVEVERAVSKNAQRKVARGQCVARPDRAAVGEIDQEEPR